MGIYKRVELMVINGLLDIPPNRIDKLIYIYKMTCKHTGHFYIGQTSSLKSRLYQHLTSIQKVMSPDVYKPISIHFHDLMAHLLCPIFLDRKNKKVSLDKFIRDSFDVYVMAIVDDSESADVLESFNIGKNIKNDLCLNKKR